MVEYWQVGWFVFMLVVLARVRIPSAGPKWWLGTCVSGAVSLVWIVSLALKLPSPTVAQWLLGPGVFVLFIFGGYLHMKKLELERAMVQKSRDT